MDDVYESDYKLLSPGYLEELKNYKEIRQNKEKKDSKEAKDHAQGASDIQSDEIGPDVTLADGEVLPQYYGKCPNDLLGQPLEDLDPYYKEKGEATFCVATKRFSNVYIYRFTASRACFVLSPFNPLRRIAVRIAVNQFFDYFVMFTIVVNCVFLALDNEIVESEYAFTAIYTMEMIIKLLARGIILRQFTYLRDGWNWLDFIVVILAWVTIIITVLSNGPSNLNLSGLRTFRVIRAFKSFTIVPGLKTIVNALLQSLKPLAEVMVIMLFLVAVISLIALQAYQGVLKRKCVRVPPANLLFSSEQYNTYVQNPDNWNPVEGEVQVCGNASSSGLCPDGFVCMQDVGDNPNNGFTNFDHFGWAMLTSFQLLTLDFWENVYNMIIRAEGAWNVLFFFMCVVLGPFYLLNLLLAVVTLAYSKEHEKQTKLREMRERAKENTRRRNKRRRILLERTRKKEEEKSAQSNGDAVVDLKTTEENDDRNLIIANGNMSPASAKSSELSNRKNDFTRQQFQPNVSNYETRRRMSSLRKDVSLESSESASSIPSGWRRWTKKRYDTLHGACCSWNCHPKFATMQNSLLKIVEHKLFEGFVVLSIVTNTVFLALDHHDIDATFENVLIIGNYVFTGIFCVEAILKILALGCLKYFKNPWNVFDFLIVAMSLLEFVLRYSANVSSSGLSVLRSLRLMRVFRLARIWTTMRKLMSIILKSLSAVVYLTIVLFMVLFIFAVVGKQLYSESYKASASKFDDNEVPRWNFNDFYHSFLLVWRVMCGEWIEPLHDCMLIADSSCIPIFLLMTFIGNFLVLNLFTAILLEAFNVDNLKSKQADQKSAKLKLGMDRFKKLLKKSEQKSSSRVKLGECASTSNESNETETTEKELNLQANSSRQKSVDLETPLTSARPRSMSIAQIFSLHQSSGKRRSITESKQSTLDENSTIENLSVGDSIDKAVPERIPKATEAEVPSRRKTLTKQPRISDDDLEPYDNDSQMNSPGVNIRDNNDGGISTGSTKKVTFAVSGNSKVYPRRRAGRINSDGDGEEEVTVGFCCTNCCIPRERKSENEVTAVVALEKSEHSLEIQEQETTSDKESSPPRCFPACCRCCGSFKGSSLWRSWTKLRAAVFRVVEHRIFEWFILLVILASTVSLALEDINLKNDPERARILGILEYIFTTIFTLEMLLKWIGIGWTKYFTNWWCVIDFVIVVISWIGIGASTGGEVESLKALRTLRALRPLRAISRWQGMRVVVNALVYCIPSIANVLCVCMLLWLVFSIIGVQQFKGKFYRCEDSAGEVLNATIVPNRSVCLGQNYTWTTPRINFDNVLNGMIALFQVATFEGWIEVMADASDTRAVDQQPMREANMYSYIFFFFFVLIGSFFILNLIVGVIIESFQKLRKQTESSSAVEAFLTESQKNFYKTMRTMLNRKPKKTIPPPDNPAQLKIFKLVSHSKFEVAVFSVIVLNMVTLAMEHYQMSQTWTTVLRYVDITFTAAFTAEAFLKIFGTRFYYFRDPFNVFDFVVVLLSITGFILEELLTFLVSPTLLRVVRVFRVFRVLRVIRAARGIRRLILTLMISLPALFNIAVLLGVFMVIFAILGMSFFMEVKLRGALNDIVNFQTFGNSMMLLFRLMTSAGWNDVLDPLMNDSDCQGDECGKYHIAIIYFVAYIFLVFLVVVNMYIAIILENFDEIFQQEESGVGQDDFEFFYVVWGRYDPKASQFVSTAELSNLLHSLHPPFQLAKPNEIKIAALNLPIVNGDKVHCLDVLFALVKRIMGEVEISDQMRQEAEARLLKSFPNRKTLKAETTTLALRQRVKAAKTIQDAWRGFHGKRRKFHESSSLELFSQTSIDQFVRTPTTPESSVKEFTITAKSPKHKPRSMKISSSLDAIDEIKVFEDNLPTRDSTEETHRRIDQQKHASGLIDTKENSSEVSNCSNSKDKEVDGKETNANSRVASAKNNSPLNNDNEANSVRQPLQDKKRSSLYPIREEKIIYDRVETEPTEDSPEKFNDQLVDSSLSLGSTPPNLALQHTENNKLGSTDKLFHHMLNASSPRTGREESHARTRSLKNLSIQQDTIPVEGKDLKFNPQTGKFKKRTKKTASSPALISQRRIDETIEEKDNEFDQSTVIANREASKTDAPRENLPPNGS